MTHGTATLGFGIGILVLFALNRERKTTTTSVFLWVPVVWLLIGGSRMVSQWLQVAPVSSADQYLDGSPLDRSVLLGLTAIGVMVLFTRSQRVASVLGENRLVLLFFLYGGASILWSAYPYVAFKRWIKACGDIVMILIVLTDRDPSAAVRQLLSRLCFLLIPLSVLLVKYYPELGRTYDLVTGVPIITGVTTGKNLLGMVCMICGIASTWRLVEMFLGEARDRTVGSLISHGILLGMVGWLLWQANSMTALLAFLLAGS